MRHSDRVFDVVGAWVFVKLLLLLLQFFLLDLGGYFRILGFVFDGSLFDQSLNFFNPFNLFPFLHNLFWSSNDHIQSLFLISLRLPPFHSPVSTGSQLFGFVGNMVDLQMEVLPLEFDASQIVGITGGEVARDVDFVFLAVHWLIL